jgi:2Fe-2S ferredoxin|tara:strand:- start:377870 stop:378205 length:336 start_codon:yes stop_codon:yes gene_type:complete
MPAVTFIHPDGQEQVVDAAIGLSLMEVAIQGGIDQIEGACGGSLSCATCHLYVEPKEHERLLPEDGLSEEEEDMLDLAFDLKKTSRLCCQIIVDDKMEGLKVALPGASVEW